MPFLGLEEGYQIEHDSMIAHKGVPLHDDHPPPRRILQQSFYTPASSVTNSVGLPSGDQGPIRAGYRHGNLPPSVRVRSRHNKDKYKSKSKSFIRSPHLQDVIERNSRRKSTESQSSAGHPILRQRWKPDPNEVDQLFDLFSKYDDILEHLARKNRRLKSFVNGETKEYPSNFSASTVEILETLEKLKLQREKSFGLGGGLDVSERLRQIKQLQRSKSADPSLRGRISERRVSSNARYSEKTLRGNSAARRNYLLHRGRRETGWRSSSAPRERYYDRDFTLSRRRRTPPRFRGSSRVYGDHLDVRESSGEHKQDYSSLAKSRSNQSRGSNYQFQTRTSPKHLQSPSAKLRYSSSRNAQSKHSTDKHFDRRTTHYAGKEISTTLHARSRNACKASEIDRSFQTTQRALSVSSTGSDDLPQSKAYTQENSFVKHASDIQPPKGHKLIGRYGDFSDSERPTLTRRPESNSPTLDRVFDKRYGRKRDTLETLIQQAHSSESENNVEVPRRQPVSKNTCALPSKTATYCNEESRDEPVSPPSPRRITSNAAVRTSPPQFEPKIWESTHQQGGDHIYESDAGQDSEFTPTKEPRKSFLPVSQTRRVDSAHHNALSVGGSSYTKSLAPSEKARRLRTQVEQVYTSSQLLRVSQEKMRKEIVDIKDSYLEKNHALEDRISKALHIDLLDHRDDASWDQIPTRSKTESFNIIEFQDGTIHLEDAPDIVTKSSHHSYRVEDGIIHVDDEYEEDHAELNDDINVNDEFAHPTADDFDLVIVESGGELVGPHKSQTLSSKRKIGLRSVHHGKGQTTRMRKQRGTGKKSKSTRHSRRRAEVLTVAASREEISSETSGNYSIQNPLTIDESNSMIVQERPKKLGRNVDIREVVLRQTHMTKDTLRDMPESLANWSDSCSVTNASEKSTRNEKEGNPGALKDAINDLRSRPISITNSNAATNAEPLETNPRDLVLSATKRVNLANEGQIVAQWHDPCGGFLDVGLLRCR